jgi:hypoxia-inducible factor 1 alpha
MISNLILTNFLFLFLISVPQLKDASDETKTSSADDNDEDSKMSSDELEDEHATLKSLDGFLLVLSVDGDITYVSENIAEHLGLTQVCVLKINKNRFLIMQIH